MVFPVSLCIILVVYTESLDYFPITSRNNGEFDADVATGIYIFISFIEQGILIYLVNQLRRIEDRYNMCNELI